MQFSIIHKWLTKYCHNRNEETNLHFKDTLLPVVVIQLCRRIIFLHETKLMIRQKQLVVKNINTLKINTDKYVYSADDA